MSKYSGRNRDVAKFLGESPDKFDDPGFCLACGEAECECDSNELEECRTYHGPRIAELERLLSDFQSRHADAMGVIGDIEQCRCFEGDTITILCDNPDAETSDAVGAVEVCGDYSGYQPQRFYGATWQEALHKAADCARRHYSESEH